MSERKRTPETFGLESDFARVRERRAVSELHAHGEEDGSNDHLASIYESQDDQFETVVPFIRQGLERGERCVYVADDNASAEVLEALRDGGVDVDASLNSGALRIFTKEDTYLRTGAFERDAMLDFWRESLAEAKDQQGYAGVRAAAEMTWALDEEMDLDRLVRYEAALNALYSGEDYVVLCQYNRDRFPTEVVSDVIRTHPLVVYDGTVCQNFHYDPPEEFFGSDRPSVNVDRTVEGLLSRARTRQTLREREHGLAALTDVSQELMQATPEAVCERVVETSREVLPATTAAVWRYDADTDELRLEAADSSSAIDDSALADRFADLAWKTFTEGEPITYDDFQRDGSPSVPELPFQSGLVLPLGRHGVFTIASPHRNAFETADADFAKTVAAATSAALDRAERERMLQERERDLEQQNEALERLNQINAIIREIDQALVQAETREEIEQAVCDRLTADDRFVFAWIGEPERDRLVVRESVGAERGYLDGVSLAVDDEPGREPAVEAADTQGVTVVSNVVNDAETGSWRKQALTCGYHSVASIPLVHGDLLYGVLTVYADRSAAFDETTRTVLGELGDTIAHALNAVERKNALLVDETLELEFEITESRFPLLSVAQKAECSLELRGVLSRTRDTLLAVVSVSGAPLEAVLDAAEQSVGIAAAHPVSETPDGVLVKLNVSGPFLAGDLADQGASLRTLTADAASARAVVEVPTAIPANAITELVSNRYPSATLVARRERADTAAAETRTRFWDQLTDRQREVAQLAYHGGYFDRPRDSTGEELAEALDISAQAFHQHLRRIQAKLFATVIDETSVRSTGVDR